MIRQPPRFTLFPYPPLFRSAAGGRPLIVTADASLLDDLLRLAAAAGVEPEVAADAGAARRSWSTATAVRSEEHTSELQSRQYLVCRLLLEKKKDSVVSRRIT